MPERRRRRVRGGRALAAGHVRELRVRGGRSGDVRAGAVSAGGVRRSNDGRRRLLPALPDAAAAAAGGRGRVSARPPRGRVVARQRVHLVRLPQGPGRVLRAEVPAPLLPLPCLHQWTLLSRLLQ